ncbi:hypothetical protein NQ315_007654 [Exocentrus adspersus]|uniref:UDP-glycosyltransferases domain-containing protein n=1 Tax=Exocentrus adspersus TaxID=1586481 RepID=A0AAV8W7L7_9CUCU|nr:hypothetical protein NQ315_007654 [Exocentrus adspersus]
MSWYFFYLLGVVNFVNVLCYNILGVFPHLGKSHVDVFRPLMKGLAEKGHNVTVLSHFPLTKPIRNYKDISLGAGETFFETFDMNKIDSSSKIQKVSMCFFLSNVAATTCETGLASEAVKNVMKAKDKYDLMITEFFNSDCFLGLAEKIKAPIIGLSSSTLMPWTSARFANPTHTGYIPNNLLDYSDRMSFLDRVENTVFTLFHQFYYDYFMLGRDQEIARKYLGRKASRIKEFVNNSSLLLVNTHFSLNLPRPLVPNVVEVGGLHIRKVRPLARIITVLLAFLAYTSALNILGVFPHMGKSHADVFIALMKGLARKGHAVTVISHFPLREPIPNYTDIDLGGKSQVFLELVDMEQVGSKSRLKMMNNVLLLSYFANISCEVGLSSPAFQNFLKTDQRFDLLVIEFFNSDCFMGLADKFKVPVIGLSSCTIMPWTSERLGNPTHTAYIPNNNMDYTDRMTFLERVENTVVSLYHQFHYDYITLSRDEEFAKKYLGEEAARIKEFIRNSSILITNSHFSLNLPRPLVPNVIEAGGLHIGEAKPLPKNIEKWINDSPDGVIYFSLGSLIKGHTFPKEKRDVFLKAFQRFPQRVLWKWENETMEGKPDNVMIQKWMPQFDILCNPNVKAFISHGGLLGITEAVHCGVPVVVMPQFGDQFTNAKALEASGGGVILQLSEATEDKVYKALKKVLSSDFRQKTKELSERFRDRPLPPLETAIYWVEYVARHKGATHMRTAAVNMPFYKYYLLDVIAFLVAVISVYLYVVYRVIKSVLKRFLWKDTKTKVKSS